MLSIIDASGPPVSAGALQRMADLERQWAGHRRALEQLLATEVQAVNDWAKAENLAQVPPVRLP